MEEAGSDANDAPSGDDGRHDGQHEPGGKSEAQVAQGDQDGQHDEFGLLRSYPTSLKGS